jgi:hypothetical protein
MVPECLLTAGIRCHSCIQPISIHVAGTVYSLHTHTVPEQCTQPLHGAEVQLIIDGAGAFYCLYAVPELRIASTQYRVLRYSA